MPAPPLATLSRAAVVSSGIISLCKVSTHLQFTVLTLTTLSHPADTMIGFDWLGENLTHDTQSLWQSSWKIRKTTSSWSKPCYKLVLQQTLALIKCTMLYCDVCSNWVLDKLTFVMLNCRSHFTGKAHDTEASPVDMVTQLSVCPLWHQNPLDGLVHPHGTGNTFFRHILVKKKKKKKESVGKIPMYRNTLHKFL